MKAQLIGQNQIRAFISPEEVAERGIDPETATYHDLNVAALINDVLLTLKDQVEEHIFKMPHRTEVIPMSDGSLILLITWSAEEREYLNDKSNTFTPPPEIPGDPASSGMPPHSLPIDELQASVMADILSALGTGNLREHLKKYLNEDFLEELLQAVSSSGLEDILSSFLSDDNDNAGQMDFSDIPGVDFDEKKKTESEKAAKEADPECLCIAIRSLSEAERIISAAGLKSFKGESSLFKKDNKYLLVLAPGKMPADSFLNETKAVEALYNGERKPLVYIDHLAEHSKTIIAENAVKALLS